ncbi:hypothetical protein [Xenorhabdus doucetiae]|uniref:Uncharacterized protein n=1 Tax=Xenorhabdus doucetiae TaxID=351671 RepID=A0A068QR39_9GAMM|nr:hypothetical protein [Xenorhabdus doucetiae]CDG17116.1 protein of unknown function [Xenorhabdus doucetiae]
MKNLQVQDKDQPGIWYRVSQLKIKLRQLNIEADIFANGRNRVIVDVYIQCADSYNNKVVVPSDILLQHTWLIDYDTGEKLTWRAKEDDNFTWAYTDEPNEFTATPVTLKTPSFTNYEEHHDGPILSRVTFYIYCSPIAVNQIKQVAALVVTPGNTVHSSAYGKEFDACIQLNSKAEIYYRSANLDIESELVTKREANEGNDWFGWTQYNKYVRLNPSDHYGRRKVAKLVVEDPTKFGKEWGGAGFLGIDHGYGHQIYCADENGVCNRYLYTYSSTTYYVHYLWTLEGPRKAILDRYSWSISGGVGPDVNCLMIDRTINIDVRQRPDALCFTIMAVVIRPQKTMTHNEWAKNFYITIYDQYGNAGTFLIDPIHGISIEEKTNIHLEDANQF